VVCSKCAASIPEDSEFCPKCGQPVRVSSKATSTAEVIPPTRPTKPGRKRHLVFWVLLAIVVAGIVWVSASNNPYAQGIQELIGSKHDQVIVDAPFSVGAHIFRYYKFSLPEGSMNVAIIGQFTASNDVKKRGNPGDANTDSKDSESGIEAYVLSEAAFTVWQNGYATSSVYESGRVSEAKIQSELPAGPGIYYLVFSNKFAPKTAKSINASILLRYKNWLPDWLRRMKSGHLWSDSN
jgi:hypothetical protein